MCSIEGDHASVHMDNQRVEGRCGVFPVEDGSSSACGSEQQAASRDAPISVMQTSRTQETTFAVWLSSIAKLSRIESIER